MIRSRENVAATAKRIIAARPVLEPIIKAFEPVFEARATLPEILIPFVKESNIRLPEFNEEYGAQGRSLLSDMSLKGFDKVLTASAKTMLPLLAKQEYLKPFIPNLKSYFAATSKKFKKADLPYQSYQLAEAYIANDAQVVEKTAEAIDVPTQALLFAFHYILAPALQALVLCSVPAVALQEELDPFPEDDVKKDKNRTAPWDHNSQWNEGYCPVCASFPSVSYLDRALFDENNQFLAGGGGKKFLHCSLCGTNWHFKRGMCVACKEEGPDVIEILKEPKTETGERIDYCTKCKSYCPNIDLRVSGIRPNLDMNALGLMHLDMIAHEKELLPLSPSFWNTF